jgi:hypothetical protein
MEEGEMPERVLQWSVEMSLGISPHVEFGAIVADILVTTPDYLEMNWLTD